MDNRNPFYLRQDGDSHIFAIALRRIALLSALPAREDYYSRLSRQQTDWLAMLLKVAGPDSTIDLRVISAPDNSGQTNGKIQIAVICRVTGSSQTAQDTAQQISALTQTVFDDEYAMTPVASEDELNSFLEPFPIADACEIARRSERIPLNIPFGDGERSLGFLASVSEPDSPTVSDEAVYHVFRFVPSFDTATDLFRLLLLHPKRTAISVRIENAKLTKEEQRFLVSQISWCESYIGSNSNHDESEGEYSRREQARVLHRSFLHALGSLQNNAVRMGIQVVSEGAIPKSILQITGNHITSQFGPSGGALDTTVYLNGGFELSNSATNDLSSVRDAWKSVTMPGTNDSGFPASAERIRWLFDPQEAVAAFRLPLPTMEELPGVECKSFRTQLITEASIEGQLIGHSRHNNLSKVVRLSRNDRRRHVYAVGQTGTGKSTMFESMILEDMRNGDGVCVIDPHGDLIEQLLQKVPDNRKQDVIVFDPGDLERPIGLNILEYSSEEEKSFLIQELMSIIKQLVPDQAMLGPIFFMTVKNCLKLIMANPNEHGTITQLHQIFQSKDFYRRFLPYEGDDPSLKTWTEEVLPNMNFSRVNSDGLSSGAYYGSKFDEFVGDAMLRNIFGQQKSTIDLREIMDSGKILFVNLSKGRMGEQNSRFFGMVLITKLTAAAMSRTNIPADQRRDFYLYVDEFQNLATENFGVLLAEARKYHLNLILTNQFVTQIPDFIRYAITGNVGTQVALRVGSIDAEYLEREFLPVFNRFDLMNLPNFYTYVSALMDGNVTKPFSMRIVSDRSDPNLTMGEEIRESSRQKYGRDRSEVEAEIKESLALKRPQEEVPAQEGDDQSDLPRRFHIGNPAKT